MAKLEDLLTEISTGNYAMDINLISEIPEGANIIGQVELTDGTNGLAVTSDGNIEIVVRDSNNDELFTSVNPANVEVVNSFATESTLDTRLSNLETKLDTLLASQDTDDNLNVKQNGSNVLLGEALNETVTAGSTSSVIQDINVEDYKYIYVTSISDSQHDYGINIVRRGLPSSGVQGSEYWLDYLVGNSNGDKDNNTGYLELQSPSLNVAITNNDTADHSYDIQLRGVR